MKTVLCRAWLAVLLGAATIPTPAQTSAHSEASARYAAGDFAGAEALLRQALATDDADVGPLQFALGNCAYRQGRLADALLAYRRATLRLPRDAELRFNTSLVEHELGAEQPAPSPIAALSAPLAHFTRRELAVAVATLQTLGLCFALLAWRRAALRTALLALAGVGVLLGAYLVHSVWMQAPDAIVLARRAGLHDEPRVDAPATVEARAGDTVVVEELGATWLRVTHAAGSGWIERAQVGLIDPGRAE
ncbi:MAG: tetratricopeptide repeat protein [Planctomycetota bacterium]